MAYTELQKRDIARELARSGGNIAAATQRLRTEYETFANVGESTVARVMKGSGFAQIIAEEGEKLRSAIDAGRAEAERDRARRDAEGLVVNRLARDESLLDEIRKKLEEKLAASDPRSISEAIHAFEALAKIIDRRHERSVPAIATINEAALLIQSLSEVLEAKLGPRKKEIVDAIKERYLEKIAAAQAATESAPATESAA